MAKQGKNTVYVIRCLQTGIHKIGITGDWARRSRELEVGSKTTPVRVARVNDGPQLEKWLHKRYKAVRLPQTEYFQLSAEQLEHVLSALDKAANDHQMAAARQQGDITRPRFEARQQVIAVPQRPGTSWQDICNAAKRQAAQQQAAATPQRQTPPAADNAAVLRAREERMRQIREQQAAANHEKRVNQAFPFCALVSFLTWVLLIGAVIGSSPSNRRSGDLFVVLFNAALLAGPTGYVLAATTTRKP